MVDVTNKDQKVYVPKEASGGLPREAFLGKPEYHIERITGKTISTLVDDYKNSGGGINLDISLLWQKSDVKGGPDSPIQQREMFSPGLEVAFRVDDQGPVLKGHEQESFSERNYYSDTQPEQALRDLGFDPAEKGRIQARVPDVSSILEYVLKYYKENKTYPFGKVRKIPTTFQYRSRSVWHAIVIDFDVDDETSRIKGVKLEGWPQTERRIGMPENFPFVVGIYPPKR